MNAGFTKFVASLRKSGEDTRAAAIISHGLLFRIGIGLVVSVISIVFANYWALLINRPDLTFYVQIAAVSLIFQVVFSTVNSAFVGLDQSQYYALTSNVQSILRTVSQIALVVLGFGITGALIGFIGGFVVAAIFGFALLFFKFLKPNKLKSTRVVQKNYSSSLKLLSRYGMPVYVSVVLVGFFPLYQQLVLAFFASDAAIGNFRAAYNFAMLLTIFLTAISTALLPAFSKLEASPELVSTFFKRANKYTTLIILPITILVVLFSAPIVEFLYGSVYTSAPLFLSLSCLLYLLVGMGYLTLTSVFNGLSKTRLTLNVTLVNFVVLIVLSPILAVSFGVVGVIVAYLIAGLISSLYAARIAVRQLKISFDVKPLVRIYLVALISCFPSLILLFFTHLSSLIVLFFGILSYFAIFITLMPLLHVVNKVELHELDRITGRIPLLKFIGKPLFKYQKKLLMLVKNN
jgi:O-antigen/teichoic acid export membrane protein